MGRILAILLLVYQHKLFLLLIDACSATVTRVAHPCGDYRSSYSIQCAFTPHVAYFLIMDLNIDLLTWFYHDDKRANFKMRNSQMYYPIFDSCWFQMMTQCILFERTTHYIIFIENMRKQCIMYKADFIVDFS